LLLLCYSNEELKSITSIVCENVPDLVNNTAVLTKHFSKFGEVLKVVANLRRKSATVHFKDHRAAKTAKLRGKIVSPKVAPIGEIFYTQKSPGGGAAAAAAAKAGRQLLAGRRAGQAADREVNDELGRKSIPF
jgi:hypothetical protein